MTILASLTAWYLAVGLNVAGATSKEAGALGETQAKASARHTASATMAEAFKPSLEMKDNVDFVLTPVLLVQETLANDKPVTLCFDGMIELHAPLCQTYVVLFARYWVCSRWYRVAVVWGEPHAGGMNFPLYPPTLNIVSDANHFTISHQLVHTYDAVFAKPLGARGPFRHRFNSYPFSDIRFAEEEALDLRQALRDGRGTDGPGGGLPHKQEILLPERSILVGFSGEGPTITIAGESHQYAELEMLYPKGGRRCVVDFRMEKINGRPLCLPARIALHSGDGKSPLRSAHLSGFAVCQGKPEQIQEEARRFSSFDSSEVRCRELVIQYWMKNPRDIASNDVDVVRTLQARLADHPGTSATTGERLKRINERFELDWMLADARGLEQDFRDYLSLLSVNGLGRMVLFGGQNILDITMRWSAPPLGEKLLSLWLEAARSQNDVASILEFAAANIGTGRVWTTVKLLDRTLEDSGISADQRFTAQACRCIALGRVCEMVSDPNHAAQSELDIAQAQWALARNSPEVLTTQLMMNLEAARRTYASIGEPARQTRTTKRKLDVMERALSRPHEP